MEVMTISESRILVLDLLDILSRYSDRNHTLSQKEIIRILESKYLYPKVRRQTIQSNIERMINHFEAKDCSIKLAAEDDYFENDGSWGDERDRRITDIYYQHKLSDSELMLIIDGILFSKQIAVNERKELIKKLEGLSSIYFSSRMGNISSMAYVDEPGENLFKDSIFDNIKKIDRAITESRKISFKYKGYVIEHNSIKLEKKRSSADLAREYIINPYHMAASIGRYYLICNNQKFDTISTYRIDRITDIEILDQKRKPLKNVDGCDENFNLNDYMRDNIYMFGGESKKIILRIKKIFLDEFIEWFKLEDIGVLEMESEHVTVAVRSNIMAMKRWALRYALYVRVLSPLDLVEDIKKDIDEIVENYK